MGTKTGGEHLVRRRVQERTKIAKEFSSTLLNVHTRLDLLSMVL